MMTIVPEFIITSHYFLKLLSSADEADLIQIRLENNYLSISGSYLTLYICDSRNDGYAQYDKDRIRRVKSILSCLTEQPITVRLSDYIEIKELSI